MSSKRKSRRNYTLCCSQEPDTRPVTGRYRELVSARRDHIARLLVRVLSQLVQEASQVNDSPLNAVRFGIRESETTDKAQRDVLSSLCVLDFTVPRSGTGRRQRNFAPCDAPSQFFRHKTGTD